MTEKITFTVDGKTLEGKQGQLLIEACEDSGIHIPRFCWHKRLDPVGMCRMCLVEIETPRGKALVPSCTTEVTEELVVETESETVKKAQEGVLEFLLINHPLDCPICDKAGECPLQDQTMAYGPGESRFIEEKRHFEKPIPVSDIVLLDRERCILCARCTRFSDEISGDPLIEFIQRGNKTQVNTFPDEPFKSYFSGNTVQICPVGALTATSYRFKARPWDLKKVSSTCNCCSLGCSVELNVSQNKMLRILGEDNEFTNQGWLSDKGRYNFEYLHSENRLTSIKSKEDNIFKDISFVEATEKLKSKIEELLVLFFGKVDERQGITSDPNVSVLERLGTANYYVSTRQNGVTSTEQTLIENAKSALNKALNQVNLFFESDWDKFQKQSERINLSPFKAVKIIRLIN